MASRIKPLRFFNKNLGLAWPILPPWTFTRALNSGRSMRSRFRENWSVRLSNGFIAKTGSAGGPLSVLDRTVGPTNVQIPTLAIVNAAGEVAPLASVAPFLD